MKEIEKIIEAYLATDWTEEKAALGTVVKVEESAYRRIGARMYVSSKGHWTGGISGGCLEGDALKRAQIAISKNRPSIVVYDTMDDDSHQIGVGLGCNGRIEVLFTPIDPLDAANPIAFLDTITTSRRPELLLQVLRNTGADEQLPGDFYPEARKDELARRSGLSVAELDDCIAMAKERRKSRVFQLTNPAGRQFDILVELIRPKLKLICVGDNYDVNAFLGIVNELGWEAHVVGKLSKLDKKVFALAASVSAYATADQLTVDEYTAVVLMSHDYRTDFHWLRHYLQLDVPYIGLLGPRKRMEKMQRELAEAGSDIDLSALPNLFSPVGLDIGAENPEEIALAITAEIVAVFRKREGGSLRDRPGPIHEREG